MPVPYKEAKGLQPLAFKTFAFVSYRRDHGVKRRDPRVPVPYKEATAESRHDPSGGFTEKNGETAKGC